MTAISYQLAEGQGFEPWEPLRAQQFSRLPHSTTLPSLHTRQKFRETIRNCKLSLVFDQVPPRNGLLYKRLFLKNSMPRP